jgi:adenylate cyclase
MIALGKGLVDIYRRFFDPYIVDLIENQRHLFYSKKTEAISLQKKDLTIAFWDISSFSELFNLVKRQYEVTLFLEQYFGLADQLVHKHDGIVNKFIGDGILAIFGHVNNSDNRSLGAIDAVNCAIEFRNLFDKMKSTWMKLWHLHFGYPVMGVNLKCGIDSGEVLFGRIGTDNRDDMTVLGRVVNLASRLEYRAKYNQILVSEETKRRVRKKYDFKVRRLSSRQRLKGFPKVRTYYELMNQRENGER